MSEDQTQYKVKFSWMELLVILIIIGMTVALLLPARQGSGLSGPRLFCVNKKKQLCAALHSYHNEYHTFPPAYTTDAEGKPLHSWRVLVLPYLEQESLFRTIRLDEPWDSDYNRQFHAQMPDIFACPVVSLEKGETAYQVLTGTGTYFPGAECRSLDDPTLDKQNTVLLVESRYPVCWMAPVDLSVETFETDTTPILSHHARHPNVVIADGTVADFSRFEIGAKHKYPE